MRFLKCNIKQYIHTLVVFGQFILYVSSLNIKIRCSSETIKNSYLTNDGLRLEHVQNRFFTCFALTIHTYNPKNDHTTIILWNTVSSVLSFFSQIIIFLKYLSILPFMDVIDFYIGCFIIIFILIRN